MMRLPSRHSGHGGFIEAADADLSDAEMRAQGRHKSAKVLPRYAKPTQKQLTNKRHQKAPRYANRRRIFVRMSNSTLVRTAEPI
jgi:hypothetical protein